MHRAPSQNLLMVLLKLGLMLSVVSCAQAAETSSKAKAATSDVKTESAAVTETATNTGKTNDVAADQDAKKPTPIMAVDPASNSPSTKDANQSAVESDDEPKADPVMQAHSPQMEGMMDTPTDETEARVFEAVKQRLQGAPIRSLQESAFPGLYEVVIGSSVIYVDESVGLLFQGELIDMENRINLTTSRLTGIHMGLINELPESKMLVYNSTLPSDRTITVFTDINCGYCRLLHSELETLLDGGINVRYLMFPRAGLDSDSRVALESVWCADDPQAAMTSAKAGEPIYEKFCDTPIEEHYALAEKVGLRGTPLIFLDNGTAIPGYREAEILVEMINTSVPYQP